MLLNCSLKNYVVFVVLYAFGYTICMLPGDYSFYLNMIHDAHLGPAMILCAKFVLAYPLAYHAINAGRHLVS